MRRYHSWLVAIGIATATPGITLAGPWGSKNADPAAQSAPTGRAPSNQEVAQKIAKALKDAGLSGNRIEIAYQNGVASLQGTVKTPEQKAAASAAVSKVPGVQRIDNRLQSNSRQPARPDLARKAPPRSRVQQVQYEQPEGGAAEQAGSPNQQMAENIASALRSARFQGYDIEIAYDGGVAVLRGAVAHPQAKQAASSIVQQVAGVERVENQLSVIPARPAQPAQYAAPQQYGPQQQQYGPPQQQYGAPPQYGPGPDGMAQGGYCPPGAQGGYGPMPQGPANGAVYDQPMMGENAWPTYAQHPNYAAVTYPKQYAASAWPYIGPFYPYPQVPMGWRKATLEWDDGYWNLSFSPRTDRWWWFLNPNNW